MSTVTKDTNPKDAIGSRKVPTSLLSGPVLMEMGLGQLEGACKYGAFNWRVAGVRASVYYDALQRHIEAWKEGEDLDPDSGLSHLVKAMCCLHVLRDAEIHGMVNDDRPPKSPDGWVNELNRMAERIIDNCPDPVPPFTQQGQLSDNTES